MTQRYWTTTEEAQLRALVADGMTHKRVATRLRRTHLAVKRRCNELGVRSVSQSRWGEGDDARLLQMLRAGKSVAEMMREFDKTERAVRGRLSFLGTGFRTRAVA